MQHASEIRAQGPNLGPALDLYISEWRELQGTLGALRVMLLMQREHLSASRLHSNAVRESSGALQQTR